jgi:formylglycine-generating enzyme required for sulfatase activity
MKTYSVFAFTAAALLSAAPSPAAPPDLPASFIYETTNEFFGSGDFNADGRLDLIIVDKESGKYRVGYATAGGVFSWVDCRPSGLKHLSGFSIGKLLAADKDALVFACPDATQLPIVEASSLTDPGKPLTVPFTAATGPSLVVAADIGGPGHTSLADLYVASIYNSPDANLVTLLRNDGAQFPKLAEMTLAGPATRGNRLALKTGQPDAVCSLVTDDKGTTLRAEALGTGKAVEVATLAGLPADAEYSVGNFRGAALREFILYKPGENTLSVRPVEEPSPGQFQFGAGARFDLGQPVRKVVTLKAGGAQKLFVIFGGGEKAGVFAFDGVQAPALAQTLYPSNSVFTCAVGLPTGFIAFSQTAGGKFSTKYQLYRAAGSTFAPDAYGTLSSLADNDNITIPDIYKRIVANQAAKTEADMQPYTNTIPGTTVSYSMVPIPGGEFVMGSPDSEADRKPDEGPQHEVKISPFWMGRCEITWNEYELFMYPDEEQRIRATVPTDAEGDKLADAVTHPSRPYVEMSFNMGKDGFPAISMTQHGANKYCQWLSAKTGHFYRLPTEAEWEYAARAGTTTAYFFGNDPSKLGDYAWYEQNSDFKYQKVGKKKPNPWGLCDIYGNVVEWVLDQYDPNYYKQCASTSPIVDPWNKATKPYPHSVRGGSWNDDTTLCRSAARRGSERAWKMTDPQLPKSIWYLTDAQWVGFRLVRPLKVPTANEMQKYWTSGVERD